MKKIILLVPAMVCSIVSIFAQNEILSKIQTTPKADKIFRLSETDNLVSFRSNNKWGLFDITEEKIILPANFDFVIPGNDDKYYVVLSGKIGWYNNNGEVVVSPEYFRLGTMENYSDYFIRNDSLLLFTEEINLNEVYKIKKAEYNYQPMLNENVNAIEVNNNLLILNYSFRDNDGYPILTMDGLDSVNLDGMPVYDYRESEQKSGIIDITKGEWVVQPEYFAISKIGENFLTKKDIYAENESRFHELKLFSKEFKLIKDFGYHHLINWDNETIQYFLPYQGVTGIQLETYDIAGSKIFGFIYKGKYGMFNSGTLEIIKLPVNDFEFISQSSKLECNVSNRKLNCRCNSGEIKTFEKNLDSIGIYETREGGYGYGFYIRKNNKWYDYSQSNKPEIINQDIIASLYPVVNVSLSGNYFIVNEFIPRGPEATDPIKVMTEFGDVMDSISGYSPEGYPIYVYPSPLPSVSASGVYDMSKRKWIVERKFSKVFSTQTGFSCITEKDNDYTIYYSVFDKSGNNVFMENSDSVVYASQDKLHKYLGFKAPVKTEFLPIEYVYTLDFWWHPVKTFINGKWGVFEVKAHRWLIRPEYEEITMLDDQNFLVSKNKKIGIISSDGKSIVKAEYTKLEKTPSRYLIADDKAVLNIYTGEIPEKISADINDMNIEKFNYNNSYEMVSFFNCFIAGNKLVVNEYVKNINEYILQVYDEYYGSYDSLDAEGIPVMGIDGYITTNTRVYDFTTAKWTKFDSVVNVIPLKGNYILHLQNGKISYADKNFNLISPAVSGITENELAQAISGSSLDKDSTRLAKINQTVFGLNAGDYTIRKVANERFILSNNHKHVLIDNNGKVLTEKTDQLRPYSIYYLTADDFSANPVYLEARIGDNHFVFDTDGKLISKVTSLADTVQRFTEIYSGNRNFWFYNGKTFRLAQYNGKDFILSPAEYNSKESLAEMVYDESKRTRVFKCYTGNLLSLIDENGKTYLNLVNSEKVRYSGLKNILFIETQNGKTKLFDLTTKKYHPSEFISAPDIIYSMPVDSLNSELLCVSIQKEEETELYYIYKQKGSVVIKKAAVLNYDKIEYASVNNLFIAKTKNDVYLINGDDNYSPVLDEPMKNIFIYGMAFEYICGYNNSKLTVIDYYDSMRVTEFNVPSLDSVLPYYSEDVIHSSAKPQLVLYRNGKNGIYDIESGVLIQPDYSTFSPFLYNIWIVDDKLYETEKGNFITEKPIKKIINLDYYNYLLQMADGSCLIYKYENNEISPFKFNVQYQIRNNYYSAMENGKYGLIHLDSSEWLIKPLYDTIYSVSDYYKDSVFPLIAGKNGKSFYFSEGAELKFSGDFDEIYYFYSETENAYFQFRKNNKSGIIDSTGKTIVQPEYDYVDSFFNLFLTRNYPSGINGNETDLVGLINRKGKTVLKTEYVRITEPEMQGYFCTAKKADGTLWLVKYNGKKAKLELLPEERPIVYPGYE